MPTPNAEKEAACEARRYDTDLTDAERDLIAPMIPNARAGARLRHITLEIIRRGAHAKGFEVLR